MLFPTGVTPLVARSVAETLALLTLPAFLKKRVTVTVSPFSIAPSAGVKLSLVKVAPAGTTLTKGGATTVATEALLLAVFGSDWLAETLALARNVPLVE